VGLDSAIGTAQARGLRAIAITDGRRNLAVTHCQ